MGRLGQRPKEMDGDEVEEEGGSPSESRVGATHTLTLFTGKPKPCGTHRIMRVLCPIDNMEPIVHFAYRCSGVSHLESNHSSKASSARKPSCFPSGRTTSPPLGSSALSWSAIWVLETL